MAFFAMEAIGEAASLILQPRAALPFAYGEALEWSTATSWSCSVWHHGSQFTRRRSRGGFTATFVSSAVSPYLAHIAASSAQSEVPACCHWTPAFLLTRPKVLAGNAPLQSKQVVTCDWKGMLWPQPLATPAATSTRAIEICQQAQRHGCKLRDCRSISLKDMEDFDSKLNGLMHGLLFISCRRLHDFISHRNKISVWWPTNVVST